MLGVFISRGRQSKVISVESGRGGGRIIDQWCCAREILSPYSNALQAPATIMTGKIVLAKRTANVKKKTLTKALLAQTTSTKTNTIYMIRNLIEVHVMKSYNLFKYFFPRVMQPLLTQSHYSSRNLSKLLEPCDLSECHATSP